MTAFTYIIPTRGRPGNVLRQVRAWDETWDGCAIPLYVIDDDDPELGKYESVLRSLHDEHRYVDYVIVPRKRLGPTLNDVAMQLVDENAVIGFMGDDHLPRTEAWDRKLLDMCQFIGMGIAYGNDKIQGGNLPTAVAMTSNIIKTLGYMVPPGLIHLFLDNFWLEIGREVGIAYLQDVIIEHMHPVAQTAEWDATYRECNSGEQWTADEAAWKLYHRTQFEFDVEKLRAVMMRKS